MHAAKPLRVGITGGIGAGKSVVSKMFSILGVPIYDADSRGKFLMNSDPQLIHEIKSLFGHQAYKGDQIDRAWIASQVFGDSDLLKRLNMIVHPAVGKDYESWVSSHASAPFTLKEAALLIETGGYKTLDRLILVTAPEKIKIRRVVQRDSHRTEADVRAIMKNQLSDDEKVDKADFIIENDENRSLIEQTMKVYDLLLAEARR